MTKRAKVIAFCGIDGCGKSTQLNLTKEMLERENKDVYRSKIERNPFNEMGKSKLYDEYLKVSNGLDVIRYYVNLQLSYYNKYDYILCDRHLLCYLAYAYAYDVKNVEMIQKMLKVIQNPDLTLYFDISVDTAIQRIISRGEKRNKSESKETLTKAKNGYDMLLPYTPNAHVLDASKSVDNLYDDVYRLVKKL